jgi:hypothetical protein
MGSDGLAQRRQSQRIRIAQCLPRQRGARRRQHPGRRRGRGLADLEMKHVLAGGGLQVGDAQHVHGDEGRDLPPPGDLEGHTVYDSVCAGWGKVI